MGRLTEDLARLRQNINESRETRLKENAERTEQEYIRATSVNTAIAGFASARANQAKIDAQALEAFATENSRSVVNLLGQFSSDHQARARQGREERTAFVADVAKKTADLIAEYDAKHKEESERSAKERSDFIANLGHEIASLLENLNKTRQTQANEAANERTEFFSDLAHSISQFLTETKTNRANNAKISAEDRKSFVTSLAEQISTQLESLSQVRTELASSTSKEREAFVSNLASSVASLINEVSSDRAGANAAFFGGVKAEKKKDTPQIVVHQAEAPLAKPEIEEKPFVQVEPSSERQNVQAPSIQPEDQPPPVTESIEEAPQSVTLWDSLIPKNKGKAGDHEKPRKKHQGTALDEKPDNKPEEG